MSIFANGDFKIQNSWGNRPASKQSAKSGNRPTSASKPIGQNKSFANVAQRLINNTPDILDSAVANKIYKDFQAQIPPPSSRSTDRKAKSKQAGLTPGMKLPPRQKTNNADDDLISSMANRLKQVQVTCNTLRSELKQKNAQIQKLKAQNIFYKGMRQNSEQKYSQFQQLNNKNLQLEKKVQQMQQYLKKYGMKWVGNSADGKLDKQKMKKDIANAKNNYRLPSQIDIGTIQRRVQQLNGGLHSQGQGTQIYSQNGVHKFRKAQPLPIAFFADGIAIKGMNFYSYKSKQSLRILSDLVDGYFPYVLKHKYPNGVFLKVVDMIATKYSQYQKQQAQQIGSINNSNKNDFKPMSKQQLLGKLPKQIIKNGKVIQIRDGIGKMFEPSTKNQNLNQYQKQQVNQFCEQIDGSLIFKTKAHDRIKNNQKQIDQFCTLKIRTQSGKICILELEGNQKIRQVYSWMKKIVKEKFNLMGNFPRRSYEEDQKQNLQDLGLCPNAILHIQLIK